MPAEPELIPVGARAPDLTLESPGIGPVRLADQWADRHVLLVFMRAFG